jgi:hypothetical protein
MLEPRWNGAPEKKGGAIDALGVSKARSEKATCQGRRESSKDVVSGGQSRPHPSKTQGCRQRLRLFDITSVSDLGFTGLVPNAQKSKAQNSEGETRP